MAENCGRREGGRFNSLLLNSLLLNSLVRAEATKRRMFSPAANGKRFGGSHNISPDYHEGCGVL